MPQIDIKAIEEKWKKYWEKEKIYKFNPKSKKKVYSVDTDPPTVSGAMHIGHAFHYAQEDFIVRFRRMFGNNIFFPFGTDDNGLPTERLVERLNKVRSKEMSREKFVELCLKTIKKIGPDFIQDWKNLGMSCDFDIYYSTIDKNSQRLSQKSFIELYKAGEIYQKEFPILWCPECQTSIAQAELEDKEFESLFLTIKFSCDKKDLLIATTRPELIGACVCIFVNPQDKKYKSFIGKKARVPLFNYEVPIIGDKSAEMDKGTGAMMVCSYGDKYDVEAVNKYKLKPRIIFNKDGTLNLENYKGLKIKDARKKILEDLQKFNLIVGEKSITHAVNVHDKCGTPIEFIPTEQWFIKILDKKKKLVEQGKKIKWYPGFMQKRYINWVEGLEWDWNISRDRHFGVPIPVWYCESCGEIILPDEKELPVDPLSIKKKCPKCKKDAKPEEKVLDTWATSSMTPQITLNLIEEKIKIPFSLRPQAHDIIRTWAFYTIAKSLMHENEIPWKDVMVSGFVRLEGEKMSKSKGNVIEPQKVMKEYSADALRFWAAGSKLGEDLNYQEKNLIAGKKLIIKLINASRFVFMNLKDFDGKKPKKLRYVDEAFLDSVFNLVNNVGKYFLEYEYSKAKFEIENFFWKNFCDNYLEIVKKRVYQGEGDKKKSAQYVLYQSLLTILKMFAPIMPFITEEIYQEHFKKFEKIKSIHLTSFPKASLKNLQDNAHSYDFRQFLGIISDVRAEKTKAKKSMNSECILILDEASQILIKGSLLEDLKNVTNAKEIKKGKNFKVEF